MPFPDGSGAEHDPHSAILARNEALQSGANPGPGALGGASQGTVPGFPPGLAPQPVEASGLPAHLLNPSRFVPSPEDREPGAPLGLADPAAADTRIDPEAFVTPTVTPVTTKPAGQPAPPQPGAHTAPLMPHAHTLAAGQPISHEHSMPVRKAVIFNTQGLNLATGTEDKPEGDGLVWKVACKTGTLALSPGPGQVDSERPLVLDDQLFSDMLLSFQEKAFPYITVPETHANGSLENTGYVRKAEVLTRDQLLADTRFSGMKEDTKLIIQTDPENTKYLLAGIDFTDPKAKEKALNGSIPDTSIGVKFGYRNKRTGKLYRAAWEHLALTPMPWVDGLVPFGLSQQGGIVDADEALEPFDGCYMPMDELNAAMRIRVRGATDISSHTVAAQIGQLAPGDEWSFDYGVTVQALQAPADQAQSGSIYYLLDTGYDPDTDQRRPPALHTTAESAAGAAFAAIQAQEARRLAREVARQVERVDHAAPVGYSQEGADGDGIDLAVFRPSDHPRDPLGRFKSVLQGLKGGERVQLPDGTTVSKAKDGGAFTVSGHSGALQGPNGKYKPVAASSADEAAKTALDRSATLTNPNSMGGSRSHADLADALKSSKPTGRGARTADSFKPDQVVSVSGIGLAKVVGPAPNGKVKVKRQVAAPGGKTKTIESVHTPFELDPYNGPTQGAGGIRGLADDGINPSSPAMQSHVHKALDSAAPNASEDELVSKIVAEMKRAQQGHSTLAGTAKSDEQLKAVARAALNHHKNLSADDQELESLILGLDEQAQDGTPASGADLSTSGDPSTLHDNELHASQDQETSNTMTVEELLAQQQAEAERQATRIAELEQQLSLSQGTIQSQGEQLHAENVAKKVRAAQEKGYAPGLLVAYQDILLADKPGANAEGGLHLSVTRTDEQGQATTQEFESATQIADYLLSAMPTGPADDAARLAAIHEGVAELHASAHVDRNSEAAKTAEVEAWERSAHPERFADGGKGPRL